MIRFALTAAAALLLAACSTPVNVQSSAPVPSGGLLPAGSGGAMCVVESQTCDRQRTCCDSMVCTPNGRLGMLCRRPYPG
jgi:uncharacterized lipoprotein YajG